MLKKVKFKNSTIILFGIILICLGLFLGMYDYFLNKKNKTFSEKNILLYESERPEEIDSEKIESDKVETNEEEVETPENETTNENKNPELYDYIGILEIPKINLKRGFLSQNSKYNKVNYNITVINGSTFPDAPTNNLILAAHSGICNVCFFNNLYKLEKGDIALIYYNNIRYKYKIVNIYNVEKDGTVAIKRNKTKNCLTLITCTRNSNTKQTVYILELTEKINY